MHICGTRGRLVKNNDCSNTCCASCSQFHCLTNPLDNHMFCLFIINFEWIEARTTFNPFPLRLEYCRRTLLSYYHYTCWCPGALHHQFINRHGINILRPRKNGQHFSDNIFKCIFLNENVWISNTIWLKFVPKGPIDNNTALVQIMAWRRTGDKPLSEPMMA